MLQDWQTFTKHHCLCQVGSRFSPWVSVWLPAPSQPVPPPVGDELRHEQHDDDEQERDLRLLLGIECHSGLRLVLRCPARAFQERIEIALADAHARAEAGAETHGWQVALVNPVADGAVADPEQRRDLLNGEPALRWWHSRLSGAGAIAGAPTVAVV